MFHVSEGNPLWLDLLLQECILAVPRIETKFSAVQISAFVHPAWNAMLHNPEVEQSWARFSTHKPRNDGLRPESNLLDLEGE